MPEMAKKLNAGFSVADADCPSFSYNDDLDLTVVFLEWTNQEIELRFPNCYAVRWQTAFACLHEGERNDEVYEIEGSTWLSLHREQGAMAEQEATRHFKLNFNACGQLEVLADEIIVVRKTPVPKR